MFIAAVPVHQRGIYVPLIQLLLRQIGLDRQSIAIDFVDQTMPRDLCGYYLLANLFYRLRLQTPPPLEAHDHMLSQGQHAQLIARVRKEARNTWMRAEGLPDFVIFAANIRDRFLLRVKSNRFPGTYYAAGTVQDVQVDGSVQQPVATASAPSHAAGPSTQAKGVDHRVSTIDGAENLRDQLNANGKTFSLTSRSSGLTDQHSSKLTVFSLDPIVAELCFSPNPSSQRFRIKQVSKQDLAVLLPVTDNMHLPHLAAKVEGSYEVAMYDEAAKLSYKRLTQLIVLHGKCTYKLPEPKCKITTPAMRELVLEVDSRLCTKAEIEKIKDSPIVAFGLPKQLVNVFLKLYQSLHRHLACRSWMRPIATTAANGVAQGCNLSLLALNMYNKVWYHLLKHWQGARYLGSCLR